MARALPKTTATVKAWRDPIVQEELFYEIVERLANGESLIAVCLETDKGYPSPATFIRWCDSNPTLAKHYARSMAIRADVNAEMVVYIADNDPNANIARNRIDARKWHNEKQAPKKYGSKVLQELSGSVDIKQKVDFSMLSQDVRNKLRAALMKQLPGNNAKVIDHEQ